MLRVTMLKRTVRMMMMMVMLVGVVVGVVRTKMVMRKMGGDDGHGDA